MEAGIWMQEEGGGGMHGCGRASPRRERGGRAVVTNESKDEVRKGGHPEPAESNRTNAGGTWCGSNRRVLAGSPARAHDLDSVELCSVTEGMGGWVCVYCWTSSSLMGDFGREWSTHVDVGTSVFVVDWVISDASDSSWCTPFVIGWLCG